MPACTRNGCKKEFTEDENNDSACKYHPGAPVFHEGLKSWSCCSDVNKPEMEFDAFMRIEGCQTGAHTTEGSKPKPARPDPTASATVSSTQSKDGKEVFTNNVPTSYAAPSTSGSVKRPPPPPPVEEEDDPSVPVTPGTKCRHNGCKVEFVSDEVNRQGDGGGAVCTYHPSSPIFHEGSKGYLCCKRRVLEFDEFLKIEGCKKGRHVFVPKKTIESTEIITNCRIDHYQTPQSVCVTIFAKQTDKTRSTVNLEENNVHLDLFLPESKRFRRTLNLFGPIDAEASKYSIMGTKVELNLKKKDTRSWNVLEKTDYDLGGFNLTFGVSGRTGTIGSREPPLLDENNKPKA